MANDITVKIGGDSSQFQAELRKVMAEAKGLRTDLGKMAGMPLGGASVKGLATGIAGVGVAVGGAVFATVELAKNLDNIGDSAGKMGVSTDEFQRLSAMATLAGTSTEAVESGINKMGKAIGEFSQGEAGAVKTFEKLGLTAEKLSGTRFENFEVIMKALQGITDEDQRLETMMEVFGKGGAELQALARDFDAIKERAGEFELIPADAIENASKATDAMDKFTASAKALFAEIANNTGLFEGLKEAADSLTHIAGSGFGVGKAQEKAGEGLSGVGDEGWVSNFISGWRDLLGGDLQQGETITNRLTPQEQADLDARRKRNEKIRAEGGQVQTPAEQQKSLEAQKKAQAEAQKIEAQKNAQADAEAQAQNKAVEGMKERIRKMKEENEFNRIEKAEGRKEAELFKLKNDLEKSGIKDWQALFIEGRSAIEEKYANEEEKPVEKLMEISGITKQGLVSDAERTGAVFGTSESLSYAQRQHETLKSIDSTLKNMANKPNDLGLI